MKLALLGTLFLFSSLSTFAQNYRICFMGDAGIHADKDNVEKGHLFDNQTKVNKKILSMNCDRVHYLGDVIYPRGLLSAQDPEICKQFLDPYQDLLKQMPIYLTMGNHDHVLDPTVWNKIGQPAPFTSTPCDPKIPFGAKQSLCVSNSSTYSGQNPNPQVIFPGLFWEEIFPKGHPLHGLCVASFDSSAFYFSDIQTRRTKYKIDEEHYLTSKDFQTLQQVQTEWLKNFHEKTKDCKVKIALAHHPYKSVGENGDVNASSPEGKIYKEFLENLVIGQFDYFLVGHDHQLSYEGSEQLKGPRSTKLMISGAGSQTKGAHAGRLQVMQDKIQKGEHLFFRKTLGFITMDIDLDQLETQKKESVHPKTIFHYSDEGSQDWSDWAL